MDKDLTPSEIVKELDKYIVGQKNAKRSVAIALRNRWRRRRVQKDLVDEIYPKNIIMIGPTGVGKTEIARRLAKLSNSPFVKIEATKFTEVGYVGKDVESMVRDLVESSVRMFRQKEELNVKERAKENAIERVLDLLVPNSGTVNPEESITPVHVENTTRDKFKSMLSSGELANREVTIRAKDQKSGPMFEVFTMPGMEEMETNIRDMVGNMMPKKTSNRKMKIKDALRYLEQEEAEKLIDMDKVVPQALKRVEESGIIFLDEIDKVVGSNESFQGTTNVSREGVQRDLLPIVEGSSVKTKYGMIKTDHILFIAAGAFHQCKPSDLIPELQGRFPIRVELQSLTTSDFIQILTVPRNSLLKQYEALMSTEGVEIAFRKDAVQTISELATSVNETTENIGARRLHTILEQVLDEVSFNAPDIKGQTIEVTSEYVTKRVGELAKNADLSRYIL